LRAYIIEPSLKGYFIWKQLVVKPLVLNAFVDILLEPNAIHQRLGKSINRVSFYIYLHA